MNQAGEDEEENAEDLDVRLRKANAERRMKMRRSNAKYLEEHPEIMRMLSAITEKIYNERPNDVLECCVKFFTRADLQKIVERAPKDYSVVANSTPETDHRPDDAPDPSF